jgi:hypothetical protein
MKGLLIMLSAALLCGRTATAQTKVANYSIGKYGTDKYEHFSFWVKNGQRAEITYSYGNRNTEFKVAYAGVTKQNGAAGFKAQFSNGHTVTIVPNGSKLTVMEKGKTPKVFAWEYEGPIDGIGTFCEPCAQDEKAAMQVMRTYYLK